MDMRSVKWITERKPDISTEYGLYKVVNQRKLRDVQDGKVKGYFPKEGGTYVVTCGADIGWGFKKGLWESYDGLLTIAVQNGWLGCIISGGFIPSEEHLKIGRTYYAFPCPSHLRSSDGEWVLYQLYHHDLRRGAIVSKSQIDAIVAGYARRRKGGT